jgi:hypothetical protein
MVFGYKPTKLTNVDSELGFRSRVNSILFDQNFIYSPIRSNVFPPMSRIELHNLVIELVPLGLHTRSSMLYSIPL